MKLASLVACSLLLAPAVASAQVEPRSSYQFLTTGNRPLPSLQYPTYGAVVAKEKGAPADVPPYVGIPDGGGGGYLGIAASAYGVGGDPNAKDFGVRSLSLPPASRWAGSADAAEQLLPTAVRYTGRCRPSSGSSPRARYPPATIASTSFEAACLVVPISDASPVTEAGWSRAASSTNPYAGRTSVQP